MATWKFLANRSGNIAVITAMVLPVVLAAAGGAIDLASAYSDRGRLQDAIDSAVLAGIKDSSANRDVTAAKVFSVNMTGSNYTLDGPRFNYTSPNYSGTVTAAKATHFLSLAGVNSVPIYASATATTGNPKFPLCMLALNPSVQKAINDSGGTNVSANCAIAENSASASAVSLSGSSSISTLQNCFQGGLSASGSAAVSPAATACGAIADPFSSEARPAVGGCTYNNFNKSGYTGTVVPGTYCGGMNFSNGNITFSPGVYIIKGGTLTTSGSAVLSGNGVVFYFTGNGTGVSLSGGTSVNLTAPSSGSLAGFIFFVDNKSGTPNSQSQLSGGATIYYKGIIYMPGQQVSLSGQTGTAAASPYTAYIADSFTLSGSATININADVTQAPGGVGPTLSGNVPHLIS